MQTSPHNLFLRLRVNENKYFNEFSNPYSPQLQPHRHVSTVPLASAFFNSTREWLGAIMSRLTAFHTL